MYHTISGSTVHRRSPPCCRRLGIWLGGGASPPSLDLLRRSCPASLPQTPTNARTRFGPSYPSSALEQRDEEGEGRRIRGLADEASPRSSSQRSVYAPACLLFYFIFLSSSFCLAFGFFLFSFLGWWLSESYRRRINSFLSF